VRYFLSEHETFTTTGKISFCSEKGTL